MGPIEKKLERGVSPTDMGDMDLGTWDMGQPGRPDRQQDLGGTDGTFNPSSSSGG
jgi:hypothetical protein